MTGRPVDPFADLEDDRPPAGACQEVGFDGHADPHGVHEPAEVRLAHDVTRHLAHLPYEEAAEEIATHIKKFWDPRMRVALATRVRFKDPALNPLLVHAVEKYLDGEIDRAELRESSGG